MKYNIYLYILIFTRITHALFEANKYTTHINLKRGKQQKRREAFWIRDLN